MPEVVNEHAVVGVVVLPVDVEWAAVDVRERVVEGVVLQLAHRPEPHHPGRSSTRFAGVCTGVAPGPRDPTPPAEEPAAPRTAGKAETNTLGKAMPGDAPADVMEVSCGLQSAQVEMAV